MQEAIVQPISLPGSRKGFEAANVIVWEEGSEVPIENEMVNVVAQWGICQCTCPEGWEERNGKMIQKRDCKCKHVALFKTWKRQGRPHANGKHNSIEFAMSFIPRFYFLREDDEGIRMGYWLGGEEKRLSTVERVLGI